MTRVVPLAYAEERRALVQSARSLLERNLTHGTAANLSLRVRSRNGMLITPSGVPAHRLRPEDVPFVSIEDGHVLKPGVSGTEPSSEVRMHQDVYAAREDVEAIVLGHPPGATGLAAAHVPIPPFLDRVAAFIGGAVNVSAYAASGTPELAKNVVTALGDRAACLIANQGAVAVGRSLDEAVEALALVEHAAESYLASRAVGGPQALSEESLEHWRAFYKEGQRRY